MKNFALINVGMKRVRTIAVRTGLACGTVLLLAACSSTPTSSPPAPTTTSAATSTGPTTTTHYVNVPFKLSHNARHDVTTSTCTKIGGAWTLKGTVRNSKRIARNYQIVVDFVTTPGNTVLFTRVITIPKIKPGATARWSATSKRGIATASCVIRQVQSPA